MAKTIVIRLEVDDKGSAVVKNFGNVLNNAVKTGTSQATTNVNALASQFNSRISSMTSSVMQFGRTASIVFAGISGAMLAREMGQVAVGFEKAVSGIRAVLGPMEATQSQMAVISTRAREIGKSFVFGAKDTAEAMRLLALAGFRTNDVLKLIPDTMNLAAAGELSLVDATSLTSDVMRGLGLDVKDFKRAVDVLAKTASDSNVELSDLSNSFKYTGTTARAVGATIEDVSTALALLANRGIRADMAGTALRRMFSVLIGSMEEGEKGLEKYNLQLFDSEGTYLGLANTMEQMRLKFKSAGLTALQMTDEIMSAFGQRAGPAVLGLFQDGAEKIRIFEEALKNASGTALQQAQDRFNNLAGDLMKLRSAITELAIEIYEKAGPALRSLAQDVRETVLRFATFLSTSDFLDGVVRMAKIAGSVIAAVVTTNVINTWMRWQSTIVAVTTALIASDAALKAFSASVNLTNFIALTGQAKLAMTGLVTATGLISYQLTRAIFEMTGLDKKVEEFWNTVMFGTMDGADVITRAANSLQLFTSYWDKFGGLSEENREGMKFAEDLEIKIQDLREQMHKVPKDVFNAQARELAPLITKLEKFNQTLGLTRLDGQMLERDFPTIWAQARKETETFDAAVVRARELVKMAGEEIKADLERRILLTEEETKARERATNDLAKQMLQIGRISATALGEVEAQFARLGSIAAEQKIPLTDMAAAYREDLIAIGAAAEASGVKLSQMLNILVGLAKNIPQSSLNFEFELGGMDRFEEMMLDVRSATTQTATSFVQEFDRMKKAAQAAGVPIETVLRLMAERVFDVEASFVVAGTAIPDALRSIIAEVEKFRGVSFDSQMWDPLREEMLSLRFVSDQTFGEMSRVFEKMATDAKTRGITVQDVVQSNREEILELGRAAELSGRPLEGLFGSLYRVAKTLEQIDIDRDIWLDLRDRLAEVGVVTSDLATKLEYDLSEAVRVAADHGVSATEVFRAHREELKEVVAAYWAAGVDIPAAIAMAFEDSQIGAFVDRLKSTAVDFVLNIKEAWADWVQTGITSFANMVGQFAVFGGKLSDMFKNMMKQMAATAISLLVQWGIQRLILGKLNALVAGKEAAVNLSSGAAQVYMNSFASAAAIPMIGWAMAPAVAAANLIAALAGAGGAAAAGAGLGVGIAAGGVALAAGGIVTQPIRPLIGEAGPEAVIPLKGPRAKRAVEGLGLNSGGGETYIFNFNGDNWSDAGVAESIVEMIHNAAYELVRRGKLRPLATEAV